MEITSGNELKFFIKADRMMNRGRFEWSWALRLRHLFVKDHIMSFLKSMRCVSYYSYLKRHGKGSPLITVKLLLHTLRYRKEGMRLGFSIGPDTLGYGAVIPHYGTIVIGKSNRIGNYPVLHTSTCVSDNGKSIGSGMFLSTGAKLTSKIILGDNVLIGANSVVNKDFGSNVMIAGIPASARKEAAPWYELDPLYTGRVKAVEELRKRMLPAI